MKHAFLAAVAVAALALPGLAFGATATHGSTAKAKVSHTKPLGMVPGYIRTGARPGQGTRVVKGVLKAATDEPTSADNLTYNQPDQIPPKSLKTLPRVMEGPVKVYTIFWQPVGYRTATNYQSTVNTFFQNVASTWASGAAPYGTDSQYFDDSTGISGVLEYGASTQDFTQFPKSGCTTPKNLGGPGGFTVIGAQVCLSDAQIQKEVKAVADRMGWPHGPNTEFFMYTPHNVESCSGSDCSYSSYCAYHWFFGTNPSNEYIYANMPWPNQQFTANGNTYQTDCDSGEHPNGGGGQTTGSEPGYPTDQDAADEVINVSSHENNEAITDPTGLGWWVDSNTSAYGGYEDGDMCAWWWPSNTGDTLGGEASNGALYTNSLNGHKYFVQGEWSNIDATAEGNSGCQFNHDFPDFTEGDSPAIAESSIGVGGTLHATMDWSGGNGAVYYFEWVRCNASSLDDASVHSALSAHKGAGAPGCTDVRDLVTGTALGSDNPQSDTYSPTAADVGDYIYVCGGPGDSWEDGDWDCSNTNDAAKVNGEPELALGSDPTTWLTVSAGTFQPGSKVNLAIPAGAFTSTPTGYTVQWQRCFEDFCTSIGKASSLAVAKTGASKTSYTVAPADVGQTIDALVVAKNKAGASDSAQTNPTDTVTGQPNATADPSWTGASWAVGTQATLNIGTWTAPTAAPITSFVVTLYRCPSNDVSILDCESISTQNLSKTANGGTIHYTPTAADEGQYLLATVDAISKWTVSAYAFNEDSATTDTAVGGAPVLSDEGATTVSAYGSLLQGYAIFVFDMDYADWSGAPTQFRYNVYRCTDPSDTTTCTNELGVAGGASGRLAPSDGSAEAAYVPSFDDIGYYIRFTVQAINANGFSASVWSQAGEDTLSTNSDAPTIAQDGDGTGYDVTPGTWNNNASQYENVILDCTDDVSTDSCTAVDEIDSIGTDSVEYTPTDAFSPDDFIRVETYAMNDDSLSEGVISDAVAAQPAPPS